MKKFLTSITAVCLILSMSICAVAVGFSVNDEKEYAENSVIPAETVDAAIAVDAQLITYAKSVVLMEKSTGKVLYAENENEKLYPASVTKIMAILLVCEAIDTGRIKLSDEVSCSDNAASKGGSQIWLEPGEVMTVEELLKATCVYSANDACTLLGEYVSGSEQAFTDAMNKKAEQLGMTNTHFDNCTGLDDTTDTHLTTAYDIALMSRELLSHDFVKQYTTIWMDSLRGGETQLVNTNRLVRFYDGITGLKTGTTEKAGCCVSATAERNGMELIAVVMGSDNSSDRFTSAQNLLDWGFANYEITIPDFDESSVAPLNVSHGKKDTVDLVIPEIAAVLTNKGKGSELTADVELQERISAPFEKDTVVGKIKICIGDEVVSEYEIKTAEAVEEMNFFTALYKLLTSFSDK